MGEAKNPGPRPRANYQGRTSGALDAVELIRPETQIIGNKQWDAFQSWLSSYLNEDAKLNLWVVPGLMGQLLAAYGKHMYESGKALFNFRHLVVFAQREHPGLRGHMQRPWEVISRWEELEPVEHRRPIPCAMLQAMVSLAVFWNWWRVASVLVISFFGCCRPGEVLKACR